MSNDKEFKIIDFPGDGIGLEVMAVARSILAAAQARVGGFRLIHDSHDAGAGLYRDTGTALSDESLRTAALVDGMGFAPSADIGDGMAVFQPAHGTAPDIAGKGWANPTAMIQSAAMMLDYLGRRHDVAACLEAAKLIDDAMEKAISDGLVRTRDAGGTDGTEKVANTVIELLRSGQADA